jgi:SRSO17 transposase
MEARYAFRKTPLLEACQMTPEMFEQVMPRLYTLREPLVKTFHGQVADQHAKTSVGGLLSDIARKNVASIASRFGQSRLPLQGCIGWGAWDDAPLRHALREHVKTPVGQADGVLVFDPSGFPTSGPESVGVARQWCGRLGKVDPCHGALSVGYVSAKGHTLVDLRLSLPTAWTHEKARLEKAGVPRARRGDRTRHQVALAMLEQPGATLPHRWRAGDDAMGRPSWCRRRLAGLGERSLLAVPSHTLSRDGETAPPASSGRGRRPQRPWHRVEQWAPSLAEDAWRRVDVRDGAKGPRVVDLVKRRVVSRTPRRQQGDEEILVVLRDRDRDNQQVVQVDFSLSNAAPETALGALARVAKAAHRLEAGLPRSKSDAGLADDAVRHWTGWHQHHTLS